MLMYAEVTNSENTYMTVWYGSTQVGVISKRTDEYEYQPIPNVSFSYSLVNLYSIANRVSRLNKTAVDEVKT